MDYCPNPPVAQTGEPLQFGQLVDVQTTKGITPGIVVLPSASPSPGPTFTRIRFFFPPNGSVGNQTAGPDACRKLWWNGYLAFAEPGPTYDLGPAQRTAVPGEPPEPLQWCPYLAESGDLYPGIITAVEGASPDGKYVNVAMRWFKPPKNGYPGGDEYGGWLYQIATGQVFWQPCGPPWP
jgi:hypothetical protein